MFYYISRFTGTRANLCLYSNKVDLRLLEEMGISPDVSFREKKPQLKTVGLMVLASVRMKRLAEGWAKNQEVHRALVKKLEGMKGRRVSGKAAK